MSAKEWSNADEDEEDGGCCGKVAEREMLRRSKSRRFVVVTCSRQSRDTLTNLRKVTATNRRKTTAKNTVVRWLLQVNK